LGKNIPALHTVGLAEVSSGSMQLFFTNSDQYLGHSRLAMEQDVLIGPCYYCSQIGKLVCFACFTSPAYDNEDRTITFFCTKECQASARLLHQGSCRIKQIRVLYSRAAFLLKEFFIQLRALITNHSTAASSVQNQTRPPHVQFVKWTFSSSSKIDTDGRNDATNSSHDLSIAVIHALARIVFTGQSFCIQQSAFRVC